MLETLYAIQYLHSYTAIYNIYVYVCVCGGKFHGKTGERSLKATVNITVWIINESLRAVSWLSLPQLFYNDLINSNLIKV